MHIRRQIELFLGQSGMAPTLFGRLVAKDPRLVHDIRGGREPRRSMVDKIRAFIDGYEGAQGGDHAVPCPPCRTLPTASAHAAD